ncbi:MAG: energy transducer TonB [Acidobacteriota bacterium]|nr:energy transducer TonB [Acidobacteriota bacterium]
MRRMTVCLIAVSLALLLSAPTSEAALLAQWREPLEETEALVQTGQYEKAERLAKRTANEISDSAGAGGSVAATLASAVVLRAVATVGMGDEDYGIWLWHTALNILPEMKNLDLNSYGPPGRVLAENPLEEPDNLDEQDQRPKEKKEINAARKALEEGGEIVPPKVSKRKKVKYPRGARAFRNTGKMVVQVILDADGKPHSPFIIDQAPAPSLAYSVLETIRQWEFEPALRDGEPVPVYYNLTVNFSLRR